jgi:hypothetical protein
VTLICMNNVCKRQRAALDFLGSFSSRTWTPDVGRLPVPCRGPRAPEDRHVLVVRMSRGSWTDASAPWRVREA